MNQNSSPDYLPLRTIPGKLRIDWYRSSVDKETLQVLNSRCNWKGAWQAIGHLALFSATGALCYVLFKQQIWFGFVLALFFNGTIGCFFGGVQMGGKVDGGVVVVIFNPKNHIADFCIFWRKSAI